VYLQTNAQTILGIDVSNNQGSINWSQVAGAGYTFAYAKATEGTGFTDGYYTYNTSQGESNGLYMGAYHFARPDANPTNSGAIAEANYFLSVAQSYIVSCELPPVLDYEVSPSLTWAEQSAWIENWMNTVQSATGITPVLYTDGSIANSLDPAVASYCSVWIADPDGNPSIPPATIGVWSNWAFKQYDWNGTVPGVSGNCDMDVFNGDINALTSFMNCNAVPTNLTAIIGACPADSITLQWTGSGSNWYVDISHDSTFADFYNQAIPNLTSINAPSGFLDYYTSAPLVLMPDSTYYWRVFNGSGETKGGSFVAPNCPSNLTATIGACPADSVILQWTGMGSGWYVDISPDSTFTDFYNQAVPNQSSINPPGGFLDYYTSAPLTLQADTTYYWRVFNGSSETSGGSFTMPNCTVTAVNKLNNQTDFTIYPNPVSTILTIQTVNAPTTIQLTDMLGQVVRELTTNTNETAIDLSGLNDGVYYVTLLTGNTKLVKKVIVCR